MVNRAEHVVSGSAFAEAAQTGHRIGDIAGHTGLSDHPLGCFGGNAVQLVFVSGIDSDRSWIHRAAGGHPVADLEQNAVFPPQRIRLRFRAGAQQGGGFLQQAAHLVDVVLLRRIVAADVPGVGDELDVVGFRCHAGAPAGIHRPINEHPVAVDGILQGVELAVDVVPVVGAVLDRNGDAAHLAAVFHPEGVGVQPEQIGAAPA